jgi:hypothetical protein
VPLLAQKAPRGGLFVGSCCVGPWLAGCRESLPSPARASESQRSACCGCATTGCAGPPSHPEAAGPGQAAAARGAMPVGRARPELFLLSVRVCGHHRGAGSRHMRAEPLGPTPRPAPPRRPSPSPITHGLAQPGSQATRTHPHAAHATTRQAPAPGSSRQA